MRIRQSGEPFTYDRPSYCGMFPGVRSRRSNSSMPSMVMSDVAANVQRPLSTAFSYTRSAAPSEMYSLDAVPT